MPFHFNYEQKYPYTDFDKINLDWILELATQLKEAAENGDFDGPPGPPGSGTATNGIAFITTSDTFADIQAAITDGQLPVLMYYNMGTPCFLYCVDYGNYAAKFGGLSGTQQLQLTWYANENRSLLTRTLVDKQAPEFYGFPTLVNTIPAGDSSHKLATTSFVQNTVTAAVQAAIEQLVIAPFSDSFKQALLQLAQNVVYNNANGPSCVQALYDALYPPINVDSIAAVWNPPVGYVVYSTDTLDSLKTYLTVTATYDDQSTAVLDPTDYTLSGTLTAGTSVITVSYAGATTTFNVAVTANAVDHITATFNQGGTVIYDTDALADLVPYLTVTCTFTNLNTIYVNYPNYVLSGSLTEGTSVITVSYGGQTDTFNVTVSISLDSIAFGTSTYREMFMTNNLCTIGDWEENINLSSTEVNVGGNNYLKINAGSPAITTEEYVSPVHSLKAFGSSSQQVRYRNSSRSMDNGTTYYCCCAVHVDRYTAGKCGVQINMADSNYLRDPFDCSLDAANADFEPVVALNTLTAARTGFRLFIGSYSSANADCYVDDVVFALAPLGITQAELLTAYTKYLTLRE